MPITLRLYIIVICKFEIGSTISNLCIIFGFEYFFMQVVSILHLLSFHTGHSIDYWVVWLLMVGTVMNPFLYVMVRASVRRTLTSYLKTLLKPFNFCRRRRSNNVAEGMSIVRISACNLL